MRIEVRTQGGFAGHIRRPPLVVDTAELDPDHARELERRAAELPEPGPPPARGADLMRYDVLVDGEPAASYVEPGVPEAARALLRMLREAGRRA